AIAAFAFAVRTSNEMAGLRRRLEAMEQRPVAAPAPTSAMPPPLPSRNDEPASTAAMAPDQATVEAAPDTTTAGEGPQRPAPEPASGDTGAAPPPLAPAEPGFEERIGTRWVVWIGGLTLALGGFFLVRYSIEAGLLGPGVRTLLGGLFALA